MKFLKQSTAAVIPFGPFVAPSDGVTLVTTLVTAIDNATTGIFLNKNGGAGAVRHATVTASTYDAYGNYLVTLDTTDTNTLGRLRVTFAAAASCLPVWEDFEVVAANIYDALVGASVNLKVDLDTIKTQAVTCAAGVTVPASIASPTNITAGTITTVTSLTNITIKKNTALAAFPFPMFDLTGAPRSGLTVTAQRRIDGGSFGSCTNAVTEVAFGYYSIDLSAADLNGTTIALRFSSGGVQDTDFTIVTQP